jgi:peroxiredoxin
MIPIKALFLGSLLAIASCRPGPVEPPVLEPQAPVTSEESELGQFEPPPADPAKPMGENGREGEGQLGPAPGGTLVRSDGKKIEVGTLYADRGAVVVFYRGHWCKPCRTQLEELQQNIDKLAGLGFSIHAISTDDPSDSAALAKKLGLGFNLYSDPGGLAANAWSVFSAEHGLARPAVFVVRPGGQIAARFVTDSPTHRPPMDEVLAAAEQASPRQ